jgi:hypothetical protein
MQCEAEPSLEVAEAVKQKKTSKLKAIAASKIGMSVRARPSHQLQQQLLPPSHQHHNKNRKVQIEAEAVVEVIAADVVDREAGDYKVVTSVKALQPRRAPRTVLRRRKLNVLEYFSIQHKHL